MKRNNEGRKVIDLGAASRETKGGGILVKDTVGRQPGLGLSDD